MRSLARGHWFRTSMTCGPSSTTCRSSSGTGTGTRWGAACASLQGSPSQELIIRQMQHEHETSRAEWEMELGSLRSQVSRGTVLRSPLT